MIARLWSWLTWVFRSEKNPENSLIDDFLIKLRTNNVNLDNRYLVKKAEQTDNEIKEEGMDEQNLNLEESRSDRRDGEREDAMLGKRKAQWKAGSEDISKETVGQIKEAYNKRLQSRI